ncbi:ABC-three component system protein [Nocardiopsis dassonvillei]|uniref:ABC-three component system protein n=1 Tax=Nocardiopsis dassonvillei TaxID=2014 RepID=UPI00366E03EA
MLRAKLSSVHGEEFESFFHRIMELGDPSFFPVRTRQGDLGADGLVISGRKLYACYGQQVVDHTAVRRKFRSDLTSAVANRRGEFDTFVFVHNDLRGVLPEVTQEIARAQKEHLGMGFENFGCTRMFHVLKRLDEDDVEELLGAFPAEEAVTGVGMAELAPLLEHLATHRKSSPSPDSIPVPPSRKLEYNGFSAERQEELILRMRYVPVVREYYAGIQSPVERDEVAAAFRQEYLDLCEDYDDPDDIVDQLQWYILGNRAAGFKKEVSAQVVLMYFFGECEIFRVPPVKWQPNDGHRWGGAA